MERIQQIELIRDEIGMWDKRKKELKDFVEDLRNKSLPSDIEKPLRVQLIGEIEICEEQEAQLKRDLEMTIYSPYPPQRN